MNIIFATKNKGKIKEIKDIMANTGFNIISMEEANIDADVLEDGETFEENALKKAIEICKISNMPVLSDDSGLEVDYLNKAPGVYSARYLGENTPYIEKNTKILELLSEVSENKRTARFVCVIAAAIPINGELKTLTARAEMEGTIAHEIKGEGGFGYDPIFYLPELAKTSAELTMEEKNNISHRGKALRLMRDKLIEFLGEKNENIGFK